MKKYKKYIIKYKIEDNDVVNVNLQHFEIRRKIIIHIHFTTLSTIENVKLLIVQYKKQ